MEQAGYTMQYLNSWVDLLKIFSSKPLESNVLYIPYFPSVFTEKPYSKPLERNIVYIPVL